MVDLRRLIASFVKAFVVVFVLGFLLLVGTGLYLISTQQPGDTMLDAWMYLVFGTIATGQVPIGMTLFMWIAVAVGTYYFYNKH